VTQAERDAIKAIADELRETGMSMLGDYYANDDGCFMVEIADKLDAVVAQDGPE
jgi:hypothetical protein